VNVLLLGRDGQLGRALQSVLPSLGKLAAIGHAEADLADGKALASALARHAPDVIVNAAAYTAVDRAESEPELADAVNGRAPAILAAHAASSGSLLVHYSTDYVFDGARQGAWTEDDHPAPLGAYGRSKLAGERAIAASGCRHLVLRTSWVYAPWGANFLLTILRLARERPELRVVDDQVGAPTSVLALARATTELVGRMQSGPDRRGGLYHLAAAGHTSWHGFAQAIVGSAGLATPVRAIPSSEYRSAARRPLNSRLDCARIARDFGIVLPDWQQGLREVMDELAAPGQARR
jgi:dTDP-4-dehydrorhamnose reductase